LASSWAQWHLDGLLPRAALTTTWRARCLTFTSMRVLLHSFPAVVYLCLGFHAPLISHFQNRVLSILSIHLHDSFVHMPYIILMGTSTQVSQTLTRRWHMPGARPRRW
jgi:hypothetical protein